MINATRLSKQLCVGVIHLVWMCSLVLSRTDTTQNSRKWFAIPTSNFSSYNHDMKYYILEVGSKLSLFSFTFKHTHTHTVVAYLVRDGQAQLCVTEQLTACVSFLSSCVLTGEASLNMFEKYPMAELLGMFCAHCQTVY